MTSRWTEALIGHGLIRTSVLKFPLLKILCEIVRRLTLHINIVYKVKIITSGNF